jgi:hypothetical protein
MKKKVKVRKSDFIRMETRVHLPKVKRERKEDWREEVDWEKLKNVEIA